MLTKTSRHTDFMWEIWSSSAQQNNSETNSDPNIHWHPKPPVLSSSKPKSDLVLSLSTYHPGSLADSTTPSTKAI